MSEAKPIAAKSSGLSFSSDWMRFVVPYLVAIASQIPLSAIYFKNIWQTRDAYVLFPLAFLVCGILICVRWPRSTEIAYYKSLKSNVFFALGIACGIAGTLLVSPWLSFASIGAFLTSLLTRTDDFGLFGRLTSIAVPLLILLQLPLGFEFENVQGDLLLLDSVNLLAAGLASNLLDLMFFIHNNAGTVIQRPEHTFDTTNISTGVFSVFSLLVVTAIYIAWRRRPFFRGLLLLISMWGWAFVLKAFALFLFAVGFENFAQDWTIGQPKTTIEITCFLIALFMMFSTDQLFVFLFGAVDITSIDESAVYQYGLTKFWNRYVAGKRESSIDMNDQKQVARAERQNRPADDSAFKMQWVGALVMAVTTVVQLVDISRATMMATRFAPVPTTELNSLFPSTALPNQLKEWQQADFVSHPPEFENPFTAMRHIWTYSHPGHSFEVIVQVRHAFPAPNSPTRQFVNDDWKFTQRFRLHRPSTSGDSIRWEFASADLYNSLAETCHIVFSHVDRFGEPIDVPDTWNSRIIGKCFARLGNRVNARLVSPQTIEISAYVIKIGALTEDEKGEVKELFLAARKSIGETIQGGTAPTPNQP